MNYYNLCILLIFCLLDFCYTAVRPKLGVSFSPAGLLTPFHLGASAQLSKLRIINSKTVLSGTSGGALAAITTSLNLKPSLALEACNYVAKECYEKGTRLTLRYALDEVLAQLIPENAGKLLNQRPGPCILGYTQLFPSVQSKCISTYEDKKDVLDILRASCNVPFYFNGNNLCVKVRDGFAIDGLFAIERKRFGCPKTNAANELIVSVFDPELVGLDPYAEQSNDQNIDIISPAVLSKEEWPFNLSELLQLALRTPDKALYEKLRFLSSNTSKELKSMKSNEGNQAEDELLVYSIRNYVDNFLSNSFNFFDFIVNDGYNDITDTTTLSSQRSRTSNTSVQSFQEVIKSNDEYIQYIRYVYQFLYDQGGLAVMKWYRNPNRSCKL